MEILGIDVGGSGIKAGIVDVGQGALISDRHRIPTPKPSKPEAVAEVIKEMLEHFNWTGPVGVCFPTVIVNGRSMTRSNLEPEWKDFQVDKLFKDWTGQQFHVINDADAAGLAEMRFGAGVDKNGLVITITIGTGLGSGVFFNGELIPNFELGRIFGKDGQPIEYYAANSARKKEGMSYKKWGKRFNFFLQHLVRVCSPDLFILGGGASKKLSKFREALTVKVPILVAEKRNNAGIIGAAMFASEKLKVESGPF